MIYSTGNIYITTNNNYIIKGKEMNTYKDIYINIMPKIITF